MIQGAEEEPKKGLRRKPPETYPISARVTRSMLNAIDSVIDSGKYLRVSDYLRDLIRKDLEERGIRIE